MADPMQDILSDLPKIQAIANGPLAQNPLLGVVLQQAMALAQIADWTVNAQRGVAEAEKPTPTAAEVLGVPDDSITLVPAKAGKNGT